VEKLEGMGKAEFKMALDRGATGRGGGGCEGAVAMRRLAPLESI